MTVTVAAAATAKACLRSATSGSVAVPGATLSLSARTFAVAAPRAWNKLLSPLRRVDFQHFKAQTENISFV